MAVSCTLQPLFLPAPALSRPRLRLRGALGLRRHARCATSPPDAGEAGAVATSRRPATAVRAPPPPPPPELRSAHGEAGAEVEDAPAVAAGAAASDADEAFPWAPVASVAAAAGLVALGAVFLYNGDSTTVPSTLDMPGSGGGIRTMISDFIEGPRFLVSMGMGVSAFIQALTGFGFAVVSVGALTQLDWIVHSSVFDTVQPVAATLGALTGWALLAPELPRVRWRAISTLLLATTLATPVGALALQHIDAVLVIRSLGALITGYVAYSLLGVDVPKKLGSKQGAWILGLLAGALGGAFDITGPPLVVHGEAAEWDTGNGEFRRNVLAVVSVNSTLVVLWDFLTGRLEDFYYYDFVKYAAPSVIVGIILGNWLSTKLDPAAFKKIVLGTCALLGVKLLLS